MAGDAVGAQMAELASNRFLSGVNAEFEKQLANELETTSSDLGLHMSASLGSLRSVEEALKRDPEMVNAMNRGMWTPLMYAVYYGHDNVVDRLISAACDVNLKNGKGQTALMLAAMCGHLSLVELLLKNDVVLDAVDKNGMNALFHAVRTGSDSVVHHLLAMGSNPNCVTIIDGLSPLLLVAAEGRETLFQELLKKGGNVNHRMRSGHTARSLAAAGHHTRIVAIIDGHLSRMNSLSSLFGGSYAAGKATDSSSVSSTTGHGEKNPSDKTTMMTTTTNSKHKDLRSLLESLGLSKYYPIFEAQDVDLSVFVTMDDADLQEIGITLYGPRVKLRSAIESLRNAEQCPFVGKQ